MVISLVQQPNNIRGFLRIFRSFFRGQKIFDVALAILFTLERERKGKSGTGHVCPPDRKEKIPQKLPVDFMCLIGKKWVTQSLPPERKQVCLGKQGIGLPLLA